jgi:UbiD family decarboxylase
MAHRRHILALVHFIIGVVRTLRDLRAYMDELESLGHVARVKRPVDLRHELAAVQWEAEKQLLQAVIFENAGRPSSRVVGNLFLAPLRTGIQPTVPMLEELRSMLAGLRKPGIVYPVWSSNDMFLQVYKDIESAVMTGLANPRPPVEVHPDWPVTYIGDEVDLLAQIPIPWYFREDAGHYLTAAVTVARDAETGFHNAGIYRIQVAGKNRLAMMVNAKRDLLSIIYDAARRDQPLMVAIAVGLSPEMLVAATMSVPFGMSEYDVAGGLAGEPYQIAPSTEADLMLPADAEFIIEGLIRPGTRVKEGPFTEYDLIASQTTDGYEVEVTAIRTKPDPIFHSLVCTSLEMVSLIMPLGMTEMAKTRDFVRLITPNVKDMFMLPGVPGTGLAVSLYKQTEAEPLDVLRALFAFSARLKRIVVVDDDVDVYDPFDVQWAVDTRVVSQRDIMVLEATAEYTDSARVGDFSVKMGIDATRKRGHEHRLVRSDLSFTRSVALHDYVEPLA